MSLCNGRDHRHDHCITSLSCVNDMYCQQYANPKVTQVNNCSTEDRMNNCVMTKINNTYMKISLSYSSFPFNRRKRREGFGVNQRGITYFTNLRVNLVF